MLDHKNSVFRPLSRLFNISQHSVMHFKLISDEFWKIHTAFMSDMNTLCTFTVSEAHKYVNDV